MDCHTTVCWARQWRLCFCKCSYFLKIVASMPAERNKSTCMVFKNFRIDYGMSSTERLYEYISARAYGEHEVRKFMSGNKQTIL